MKVYYGYNAFNEAYATATAGSTIILSGGSFDTVDSIAKPITIIGNGYMDNPTTLGTRIKSFPNSKKDIFTKEALVDDKPINLLINANNVKIEGIKFSHGLVLRGISNLHISHCYIPILYATAEHNNTIVDQCYIEKDYGGNFNVNYCIKNSFIDESVGGMVLNCVVYRAQYYDDINIHFVKLLSEYRNSIMGFFCYGGKRDYDYWWNDYLLVCFSSFASKIANGNNLGFLYPFHWDGNSFILIDYLKTCVPKNSEIGDSGNYDSYANIFDDNLPWYDPNYIKTTVTGDDGTVVGPYGGTGFSLYPSIPRITESKIDTYTNGEGKLNVKVKVEVGQ